MGRLFWKFFFVFWLAQVVTSVGVGVAIWLEHPARGPAPGGFEGGPRGPPPEFTDPEWRPPPPLPGEQRHRLALPLFPILAGSLVSLVFAALLAGYFARPIRHLRTAFKAVSSGRLETRIGAAMGRRNDELADLGGDFDHMAERLQNLVDTQRRLLHDVSHELRSPLARLQASADLMLQQPGRAAEFAARIEREIGRMDRLVGELLTLARLDAGMTGALDEEVDLGEIIAAVATDARFEAGTRGGTVDVELAGVAVVRGSPDLLYRAVENVVRNAVRHAPAGSAVVITLAAGAVATWCITVADRGGGVFESDLEAIFEPFFRGGRATSPGYGLGLAITRRVVAAHGGTVGAANRSGGGLRVTLVLPAAAPLPSSPAPPDPESRECRSAS